VISTSGSLEAAGTQCLGNGRQLTCPGTFYFALLLTASRPIFWVISMASADICSIARNPRRKRVNGRLTWAGIPRTCAQLRRPIARRQHLDSCETLGKKAPGRLPATGEGVVRRHLIDDSQSALCRSCCDWSDVAAFLRQETRRLTHISRKFPLSTRAFARPPLPTGNPPAIVRAGPRKCAPVAVPDVGWVSYDRDRPLGTQ
jgi:hypothetical protein